MPQNTFVNFFHTIIKRQPLFFHIACIFLCSVGITLLFWAFFTSGFHTEEAADYLTYYEPVARNLLNGKGIVGPNDVPAINNPPGYSILLAGVFAFAQVFGLPENLALSGFVLLCMGLSSAFVFLLSEKIWGLKGAWISALFFMTYPFVLWLTKQPGSEAPFMVVFFASLYLFWRGLKDHKNSCYLPFITGVFIGGAVLIRGIAIGTGFLLFGLFLKLKNGIPMKSRFLLALALLLGNFLTVLPWQMWVYGETRQLVLLGASSVYSIKDGLTFAVEQDYRQEFALPEDVVNLQNEFAVEIAPMTSLGEIFKTVIKHLISEPVPVLKLFAIKVARSGYGTDSGRMEPVIFVIQLFYAIFVLLATFSVWRIRFEFPGLLLFVWGLVFYFWMMTTLVLSILRYMTPTIGLLSLLMPGLIHVWLRRALSYGHHD